MEKVIKLLPSVHSYIWGGTYFQKFGKGDCEIISELWELSVRGEDSSLLASDKERLDTVLTEEDIGPLGLRYPYFPLLIKLIDAKDNLSVQVHPSDEYALEKEHSFGKSEMWHIIDADEGAGLYVGLNDNYDKETIRKKLNNGTILNALNFFEVKKGDTFVINPGTIHAIGKGVRLIEIQQNSNLTYRLYDYNRVDKNGNPRELHIDKALEVINYSRYEKPIITGDLLADNEYFVVSRKYVNNELEINADNGSFISFTFLNGEGFVEDIPYKAFDTFFLPANKKCIIKGTGEVIISTLPR